MRERLLTYLACPTCHGNFNLVVFRRDPLPYQIQMPNIAEGLLKCQTCHKSYPIYDSVPRFVAHAFHAQKKFEKCYADELAGSPLFGKTQLPPGEVRTANSFSKEWEQLADRSRAWQFSPDARFAVFLWEVGVSPETLQHSKIVDIGCGNGYLTAEMSKRLNSEVIGVDLSGSVVRAEVESGNEDVHFIQASVFDLPLKPNSFDLVYSSGVLHHTYNTKLAFLSILPLGKPNGTLCVWLYGKKQNFPFFSYRNYVYHRDYIYRWIISRLPSLLQNWVVSCLAYHYLWRRNLNRARKKIQARQIGEHERATYEDAILYVRDGFTPIFAHKHTVSEVNEWLKNFEFQHLEVSTEGYFGKDRGKGDITIRAKFPMFKSKSTRLLV